MKKMMEIPKSQRYKTLLDLGDIQIKADLRNWVLFIPPRTFWYYSSVESLFNDLLDLRIKDNASKNPKKDIQSFGKAIEEARGYISTIIKGLTTVKTNDSSRLNRVCKRGNGKDG